MLDLPPEGQQVHLTGYGFIKVFRPVSPDGDVEHWAINDRQLTPAQQGWEIETDHRSGTDSNSEGGYTAFPHFHTA